MSSTSFHVLFESATGYAIFSVLESEDIATLVSEVQNGMIDLNRFQRVVKLIGFHPFDSAENALENMNAITEHEVTADLKTFLESTLNKGKKSAVHPLGVIDPQFATAIQENTSIPCRSDDTVRELTRGIRVNFSKFVKLLDGGLLEQSQLGLGHAYSRSAVKFNPNRADNMIIQSIALLDQMDKDINTMAMRVREWYSWHFPELKELVKDNFMFARCASFIKDKSQLTEEKLEALTEIVADGEVAARVVKAAKISMGMDVSPPDMVSIACFTDRMVALAVYRQNLYKYLEDKMATVAPNLSALIGETVAARLIQKAGSLTSLAKCPASTVQILGAEKALFRALKTKGNTPKYGLIYHSTFIGRASAKNKGRISRYLANKCAIASRIDSFIEEPTKAYGEQLRDQVEERLKFYDTGDKTRKNIDVMTSVASKLKASSTSSSSSHDKKKKHKSTNDYSNDMDTTTTTTAAPSDNNSNTGDKKHKKKRPHEHQVEAAAEPVAAPAKPAVEDNSDEQQKKKKKKHNRGEDENNVAENVTTAVIEDEDLGKESKKKKKHKENR